MLVTSDPKLLHISIVHLLFKDFLFLVNVVSSHFAALGFVTMNNKQLIKSVGSVLMLKVSNIIHK